MTTHRIISQLPHTRIEIMMRYLIIVGFITALSFAFLLLMFMCYIAQLCIASLSELLHTIAALYNAGDSFTKLLIIVLMAWLTIKIIKRLK